MTPGLRRWDTDIRAGDVTAIALQNNVPIAVGVAAFDIGKLSKSVGERGKAVYLVHCYHDELWGIGSKSQPPIELPKETAEEIQLEDSTKQLSLEPKVQEETALAEPEDNDGTGASQSIKSEREPSSAGLPHFSGNANLRN